MSKSAKKTHFSHEIIAKDIARHITNFGSPNGMSVDAAKGFLDVWAKNNGVDFSKMYAEGGREAVLGYLNQNVMFAQPQPGKSVRISIPIQFNANGNLVGTVDLGKSTEERASNADNRQHPKVNRPAAASKTIYDKLSPEELEAFRKGQEFPSAQKAHPEKPVVAEKKAMPQEDPIPAIAKEISKRVAIVDPNGEARRIANERGEKGAVYMAVEAGSQHVPVIEKTLRQSRIDWKAIYHDGGIDAVVKEFAKQHKAAGNPDVITLKDIAKDIAPHISMVDPNGEARAIAERNGIAPGQPIYQPIVQGTQHVDRIEACLKEAQEKAGISWTDEIYRGQSQAPIGDAVQKLVRFVEEGHCVAASQLPAPKPLDATNNQAATAALGLGALTSTGFRLWSAGTLLGVAATFALLGAGYVYCRMRQQEGPETTFRPRERIVAQQEAAEAEKRQYTHVDGLRQRRIEENAQGRGGI